MVNTNNMTCCVAIIFIAGLNAGCLMHLRQVPPDAAFIRQIGLPVYPRAALKRSGS